MKSLLVANEWVSQEDPTTLTRGQIACYKSDGSPVDASTTFKPTDVVKFCVGLGDGKTKEGVWINPLHAISEVQEHREAGQKVITFTSIGANPFLSFLGEEVSIVITCQPKNSYNYPNKEFDAVIVIRSQSESETSFLDRLKVEVRKQIALVNDFYGAGTLVVSPDNNTMGTQLTFTGKVGFNFNVTFNGAITGTKTVTGNITSVGSYEEISEQERFYDVWSVGYNPNIKVNDEWYGDIFLADSNKVYNVYTIISRNYFKHVFNANTEGLEVTQFIAFDSAGTATDLEAVLAKISTVNIATNAVPIG